MHFEDRRGQSPAFTNSPPLIFDGPRSPPPRDEFDRYTPSPPYGMRDKANHVNVWTVGGDEYFEKVTRFLNENVIKE